MQIREGFRGARQKRENEEKMKRRERDITNINLDYWFLRDNGVSALTSVYIVGLAYNEDELILIGKPRI